jgi:transposase-like protein
VVASGRPSHPRRSRRDGSTAACRVAEPFAMLSNARILSQDFREIIVQALSERGMGNSEVVHSFGVGVSWVKRYTRAASEGRFLAPKTWAQAGADMATMVPTPRTTLTTNNNRFICSSS